MANYRAATAGIATLFGETYTYDQANALAGKWFH